MRLKFRCGLSTIRTWSGSRRDGPIACQDQPGSWLLTGLDRNGQPDLDFGAGTGSVTVDLGAALLGEPVSSDYIDQMALDPDGEHVVARLSVSLADGSLACSGIARLAIDGAPDTGFGRNGLTCLNLSFALIALQSDGAPLFFADIDNSIRRLLPDNHPSPGFLSVVARSREAATVGESDGMATVTIERLAGRDSAVSVNYTTAYRAPCHQQFYCSWNSATAGSDYVANSGRLDWASGDDSQLTVTVSILNDDLDEILEILGVDFSDPGGDAQLIDASTSVFIADDDVAPPPPASGGGGSVSWATPLALLTLLLMRRRRDRVGTTRRSSCCA